MSEIAVDNVDLRLGKVGRLFSRQPVVVVAVVGMPFVPSEEKAKNLDSIGLPCFAPKSRTLSSKPYSKAEISNVQLLKQEIVFLLTILLAVVIECLRSNLHHL